jgi:polar amino acid transport system substrate-binding protein
MRFFPFLLILTLNACATGPNVSPETVKSLAPTGTLRAAINYGNTVLAQRGPGGEPAGVSADLARELARELGLPLQFVTYTAAGQVTDAATKGVWDIAFVAIDPKRAQDIDFTPPYVLIEGGYMVRNDSPLRSVDEVDRAGNRVAVGAKSAYDLYLTRTLKQAQIVRAPTSPAAIEWFLRDRLEVVANVKQPLVEYARANPGVRVMPGRFMAIEQAMAVAKGRPAGYAYVRQFIERKKADGFVAAALQRSNQPDAAVAPPAN